MSDVEYSYYPVEGIWKKVVLVRTSWLFGTSCYCPSTNTLYLPEAPPENLTSGFALALKADLDITGIADVTIYMSHTTPRRYYDWLNELATEEDLEEDEIEEELTTPSEGPKPPPVQKTDKDLPPAQVNKEKDRYDAMLCGRI